MNQAIRCDGMLTIEFQHPVNTSQSSWSLDKQQASDLTNLIAKDLKAVLGIDTNSALVVCGNLFSSEQLIQPKFPIQQRINQYATAAFQGEQNNHKILSIGASDGQMPEGLQAKPSYNSLFHMPFCLYCDDAKMAEQFESNLMHKGMISPPTYQCLQAQFDLSINHANYMSYLDLVAMMHNHFEQMGMSDLWQIIETAILSNDAKTAVITQNNNYFYLVDHLLFSPWFSVSQFCQYFNTKDANKYIEWLMAQRMAMAAFTSHGLEIKPFKAVQWPLGDKKICLGSFEQQCIKQTFWAEQIPLPQDHPEHAVIYQHPQTGITAVSLPIAFEKLSVYYPVSAMGIKDIQNMLEHQSISHKTVAFEEKTHWLI